MALQIVAKVSWRGTNGLSKKIAEKKEEEEKEKEKKEEEEKEKENEGDEEDEVHEDCTVLK